MSTSLPPPGQVGRAVAPDPLVWSYAGFWWRVLAFLIDSTVLGVVQGVFDSLTGLPHFGWTSDETGTGSVSNIAWNSTESLSYGPYWPHGHVHGGALELIGLVVTAAYYVLLESSRWQATLGKRVCRMQVTDLAGRRIGILRALGRHLGKFVSAALFGIGFLMVGWTRRKQGLHDMMAGTLVMRLRPAETVFAFQPPRPGG